MGNCRKFRVTGRVQGVWFRESTRREAEKLGLNGYAVNCADGSVEVLACGAPDAVEQLARWLHHGPQLARVDSVEGSVFEGDGPDRFTTGHR